MDKVKVCFVGCGDHANRFIYPALANVKDTELAAVCSLDAAEAELNRQRHGAARAYTDYQKMLDTEKPDAAVIVGPPRLHHDAGLYCLERHIPFYIEKPPGENLAQATALADASRRHGTFGQVGFMMRHSAVVKQVNAVAANEQLGELRHARIEYFTSGPYRSDAIYGLPGLDDRSFLWRYLLVQAVHPVNLAASFLGELAEISSDVIFSGEDILVEIRLKDVTGRRAEAALHTFVAPGYGNLVFRSELCYERRGMIFTDAFSQFDYYPPTIKSGPGDGNIVTWRFPTFGNNNVKMGYETEIASFIASVKSGTPPATDLHDGLKTMRILTEVSNQQGQSK